MKRLLICLILLCSFTIPAYAQDGAPISPVKPDSWVEASDGKSESRIADWTDPKTESRIEIRAQHIVRAQHANTLYSAFNDQLIKSNFRITAPAQQKNFQLVDSNERTGVWTEYEYTAADIPITVVTYGFTANNTAILIIGYFSHANTSDGIDILKSVITKTVDNDIK